MECRVSGRRGRFLIRALSVERSVQLAGNFAFDLMDREVRFNLIRSGETGKLRIRLR